MRTDIFEQSTHENPSRRKVRRFNLRPRLHRAIGISVYFLLTLALATVVVPCVHAQTQADLAQLGRIDAAYLEAKRTGKWAHAAELAESMIELVRRRGFPVAVELAAIDQLALARLNEGKYQVAWDLYQQVLNRSGEVRPTNEAMRNTAATVYFNALMGTGRSTQLMGHEDKAFEWFEFAIQFANKVGHTTEETIARSELCRILIDRGQYDDAIEVLLETLPMLKAAASKERPRDATNTMYSNALQNLALCYMEQGRFDLAEPRQREALDVSVRTYGWNHNFTANSLSELGRIYQLQNRTPEAERMLRIAVTAFENSVGRRNPQCAIVLNNLARLLEYSGRSEEAEPMAREALSIKQEFYDARHHQVATSQFNLANILANQDQFDEAESLLTASLDTRREIYGETHVDTAECMQLLASIYWQQDKSEQALDLLDRALEIHQQNPFNPSQASSLHAMRAFALHSLGRRDEANEEMAQCLAQSDLQRAYTSGAERERATFFADVATFYYNAITFQAETGNVEEMFRLVESLKARSFLDELQLADIDLLDGMPEAERRALEEQENALRRQLSEAEERFNARPDLGPSPKEGELAARRQAAHEVLSARQALYEHLTNVRNASPAYRNLLSTALEAASIASVQEHLAAGEVFLTYSIGYGASYVIVIRHDAIDFEKLTMTDSDARILQVAPGNLTIDDLSTTLLSKPDGVLSAISSPQPLTTATEDKLAAFWRVLVPEKLRQELVAGDVSQLVVSPAGALALLPFETLIVNNGEDPQYLLDVGPPISYAPSATVLLNLVNRQLAPAGAEPVLALGDPAYPQTGPAIEDVASRELASVATDAQFRAGLSRLPASGLEAAWVKQNFDRIGMETTKLIGAEATEGAVRRLVGQRQIVHLACHGMADETYGNFFGTLALAPGRSGDPRDDGFLSMSELYELDLDACELAILSACETNFGPQQQGEGVWALSRGFLVAGARRVVASNWVVSDEAGATLVSYFTDYLARQGSEAAARDYATALRDAKRLVRRDPRWSHPFYWSSLVLVGPH